MRYVIDTETFLITEERPVPEIVCLQYKSEDMLEPTITIRDMPRIVEQMITPQNVIVGQNIAFDNHVLAGNFPELAPLIWDGYIKGIYRDTMIRQQLLDIAAGTFKKNKKKPGYSLEAIAERYGFEKDGDDPWRLKYGELAGIEPCDWPRDAYSYAAHDVTVTEGVYLAQDNPVDEIFQTQAAWTMYAIGLTGVHTDKERVKEILDEMTVRHDLDFQILVEAELVRETRVRDMKAIRAYVTEAYKGSPPMTEKGNVKADEETLLDTADPLLKALQRFGSYKNLLKRVHNLECGFVRGRFYPLVDTGRTSCQKAKVNGEQLQNVPKFLRKCFVPGKGELFVVADYHLAELHSLAQVCFELFGRSKLGDALRAGTDVHSLLASQFSGMSYEQIEAGKEVDDSKEQKARSLAKNCNFALPGGVGIDRMGKMIKVATKGKILLDEDDVKTLKFGWLKTWTEMADYFRHIRSLPWINGRTKVTHKSGMVRGGISYTEACNTFFQERTAQAAKHAAIMVHHATDLGPLRGWRIWNFVHDEICIRGPEDSAEDASRTLKSIMEIAARPFVPDFPVTVDCKIAKDWVK